MKALFFFALLSTVLSEQVVEITNEVGEIEDSVEVVVSTNDVRLVLFIHTCSVVFAIKTFSIKSKTGNAQYIL